MGDLGTEWKNKVTIIFNNSWNTLQQIVVCKADFPFWKCALKWTDYIVVVNIMCFKLAVRRVSIYCFFQILMAHSIV